MLKIDLIPYLLERIIKVVKITKVIDFIITINTQFYHFVLFF